MRKYTYLFLLVGLGFAGRAQDMKVDGLYCEYRKMPMGMDEAHPRLSWELFSWKTNQYQSAYRILIAKNRVTLAKGVGDLWDSGKVTDSENINIVPGGRPLEPFTRYYWKVMVWDQTGHSNGWSDVSWFETGMLGESNWKGKWIGDNKPVPLMDADFYKDDPAPVFRKAFALTKKVRSARLYISGLGYNEPSINGVRVSDAVLDPAWTDYAKTIFYSVYDVGGMLKAGANAIDVLLGNGWYNPLPLRFWGRINFREALTIGRPKVLANLRIVYVDGSVETIATDERWLVGESGVLRNNVFLGEKIDGRRTVGELAPAVAVAAPGGRLEAAIMPAIKRTRTFVAKRITEPSANVFVVDMGYNFAGLLRMRVHGRAGQEVHLRYGEIMANGRVNGLTTVAGQIKEVYNLSGGPGAPPTAYQEDVYICKGDGSDVFQPHFTFHGFRFVEITGLDRQPADSDFLGIGLSTQVEGRNFICSDTMVKDIQRMVTGTFLSNLFSVQSDCPGREKQGYGGDIVATADAYMYNFDMSTFYAKTLRDFADAVRPNGGMTECAPFNGIADEGFGEGTGPIGWQLAFPFLQREMYRFYGNRRVVEEQYGRTVRLVEFLRSQAKGGLINHGIGDHEAVNPKHVALTSAAFYYGHVKLLAELAGILGRSDDQRRWSAFADTVRELFNAKYLQADGASYDTAANQTTQVFALWWGLAKNPDKSFDVLVRLIEDSCKGHLSTGIFGTKMLWDVLRRFERNDLAFRIATQREFPGYGYMLEHGASTLIESWALTDQNSWNHPMFGSVSEWFFRGLAGINPAEEAYGMNKVLFRIQPLPGIKQVHAGFHCVRGGYESLWFYLDGKFNWVVGLPPNTRGEADVPAGMEDTVTEDGRVLDRKLWSEGYYRVQVVSGTHQFIVKKAQ